MVKVDLLASTGDLRCDKIISGVIGVFETTFPDRIRGYYLRGSRTNPGIALNLKHGTQLLYGEDIRPHLPPFEPETYVRDVVHTSYFSYKFPTQRRDLDHLTYPLHHIDPNDQFYGYTQWTMPTTDGSDQPSTKLLIASVGWTATAIVALRTHQYVRDQAASVDLYRTHVGDEWTDLVVSGTTCADTSGTTKSRRATPIGKHSGSCATKRWRSRITCWRSAAHTSSPNSRRATQNAENLPPNVYTRSSFLTMKSLRHWPVPDCQSPRRCHVRIVDRAVWREPRLLGSEHDSGRHQVFEKIRRKGYPLKLSWAEPTGVVRVGARRHCTTGHGRGEVMDFEDSSVGCGDGDGQ